jgi:translation initiation factor IF-2
LAKELNLDSKELVDACRKAGIPGKGSALASLTDDEAAKVRAFFSGGDKKKGAGEAESAGGPAAPVREEAAPTYTRDDYIAPGHVGRIKVLDVGPRRTEAKPEAKPEDAEAARAGTKKKREPVVKLAEMPEVKQPAATPKKDTTKAQKPEIRLSKQAIAGHKAGQKAPLEELTKEHFGKAPEKPQKRTIPERKKADKRPAAAAEEAPLSVKAGKRRRPEGFEEADRGMAGMATARADRQKARKNRARSRAATVVEEEEREVPRVRRPRTLTRRRGASTAAPRKEKVALALPCTVRSFSEATGVGSGEVLKALLGMGVATLNINAQIEYEMTELLAAELGVEVEFKQHASLEETLIEQLEQEDVPETLQPRPPVVTFLGHVDHGKTSLLDYIIGTNVVAGEAGGITQHIRAYEIAKDGRRIAFVDTPGHEAFTEMRARGANVTDIAVLVIAADDGVMPQTEEAISHARAAEVPIVVALNKMDLPGANPDRVLQQLAAQNLLPSEWGGEVEVVRTSAATGDGIDNLLETILVTAELHEYKANPERRATGVCLEAEQQSGRGVVAKLLVQNGTLRVGDVILSGCAYGRVKAMYDTLRPTRRVDLAGPSTPVNITGFDEAPGAGDRFYVLEDISGAREIALQRASRSREQSLAGVTTRVSFEEFQRRLAEGNLSDEQEVVTLNLIIRADVRGSIEAIEKELAKLEHPEVHVKILHKAVGAITAADVMLAHASHAVVIGFSVIPDDAARALADEKQVEIRRYDIIYKVTDDIRAMLEGKLKPEERVVELGHAVVKRVFPISRVGTVAGCYVVRGSIARGCRVRVNREGRTIGDYALESLRHEKEDIKEVPRGMECGMKLAGFNDVKQDDILEAYVIEEVARTL